MLRRLSCLQTHLLNFNKRTVIRTIRRDPKLTSHPKIISNTLLKSLVYAQPLGWNRLLNRNIRDSISSRIPYTIPHRFCSGLSFEEDDLDEQFVRGSGAGGQKINKTANCVILKHKQTGIIIKCQQTRSLAKNRQLARQILSQKLEDQHKQQQHEQEKEASQVRARNAKRTRKIIKKHFKSRRDRTLMD